MRSFLRWPLLARVAVALGALTAIWAAFLRPTGGPGWIATVLPNGEEVGPPLLITRDLAPTTRSVERLEQQAGSRALAIRWNGVLMVDEAREYRIGAAAAGRVRLRIDNHLVFERAGTEGVGDISEGVTLAAGAHAIVLEFERGQGPSTLELRWDVGNPYRLTPIPASSIATRFLRPWQWTVIRYSQLVSVALGVAWTGVLLWLAGVGVRRVLPAGEGVDRRSMRAVLAGAAVLFVVGIWWGWPGGFWAPDEVEPFDVLSGLSEWFSHGWHHRYPPLHYYVLSVLYAPTLGAVHLGWLEDTAPAVSASLAIIGRLTSVAMSFGTIYFVGLLATRLGGRSHGSIAALLAALFLPLTFYAKMANLDAPYLFWFALSLLFLIDAYRTANPRATAGFAIAAALAIATKDQAYALYVLPSVHLAITLLKRGEFHALGAAIVAGLATLAVAFNVVVNWEGFKSHVALITGPASEGYRTYPQSAGGQWQLAVATARELVTATSVPGALLTLFGLFETSRAHVSREHRAAWWTLLLIPVSYYLTFIAVIGSVYDRFLMPVLLIAAVPAATGLHALWTLRPDYTRAARLAAAVIVLWLVWRAASVDALLVYDARYVAEDWLRTHMTRDYTVASVNPRRYLPRLDQFRHFQIQPIKEDTLNAKPEYIVVNTEFAKRDGPDSEAHRWLTWLASDEAPYREAFRIKHALTWSALRWQRRFTDRVEDPFSNLDKANPEIVIYRRLDIPTR